MNHIENIEIKNFKSIKHAEIKDCRRVNVFIGYPNVGKSNILEALGLYGVPNMVEPLITDVVRVESNPSIFFNGDIEKSASISLNGIVKAVITYLRDGKLLLNCAEISETNKVDNSIFRFFINKDLSMSEAVSDLGYDFTPETSFTSNIFKYTFNKEKLGKSYDDNLDLDTPYGTNLYSTIQYNSQLRKEVQELLKEYSLSIIFDQSSQMTKVVKKVSDDNIFLMSFDLLADTLLRLIFYKAAILLNKDRETIFIFEEPEAHMFPPYIKKFTTDVIFDETNQFFIATHSPYVLNEFIEEIADELAVYVVDYDKGETIIKRLTDKEVSEVAQYGVDLFFNLETYLDKNVQHSA